MSKNIWLNISYDVTFDNASYTVTPNSTFYHQNLGINSKAPKYILFALDIYINFSASFYLCPCCYLL